ncbi:MAG: PQQ-like beta-propeller repeat protein [Actinobacteria bacterium]|nr:PQQ-like beta-propeller repeat protein [Actinomycetota bacterium]
MASSPVRDPGRAPAIWVGVVVVALFAASALLGRPPAFPDSGAAAWLPPDGTRVRYSGPGGTISTEWALDQAVSLLGSGPPQFLYWLGETQVEWETASVARVVNVSASPTGDVLGREDDLLTVAADGVRTEVEAPSAGATRIYVPGRLDVPAAMAAGSRWTSIGTVVQTTASGSERLEYSADYDARTPDDPALIPRGCVVVTMRERIGTLPTATSEATWCRHAGILSFQTLDGAWHADTSVPTTPSEPVSPSAVALDWSRADQLTFRSRTVNTVGVNAPQVAPVSAPALLPDGTVVVNSQVTQDVIAVDATGEPASIRWNARPGGRNTATTTFGTITIATGSGRHLVAYGPSGRWLWQQHLSDVAIVTPARLGDLVVVPTLDGRVTAYDLGTGAERWSWTSSAEIRVAPVATADRVVVIDQAGQLTCLDPDGNEVWTVEANPVQRFTVWTPADGDAVVVLPEAGGARVQARSLADGGRLWRVREFTVAKDVIALDHLVLLRDADTTVALDPLTGERRWSWSGSRTLAGIGGGTRALLLTETRLLLFDEQGSPVKEWALPVAVSVGTPYLVASGQRVLVYTGTSLELGTLS